MTGVFGALSDATRLRMVRLMASNDAELCVCELVDCLEEPQYHVSRHLRELRACGLLRAERDGRWMYYSLNKAHPLARPVAEMVAALPSEAFAREQRNFEERVKLRAAGRCRVGIQREYLAESTGKGLEQAAMRAPASALAAASEV